MTEDTLKQQLADITSELYQAGIVTAIGGNLSVRCATRKDAAWITPSLKYKGALSPEDMVMIDLAGNLIEGDSTPSMESMYHANILKQRPAVNAVVHSHAPLSIVFGLSNMTWKTITIESILFSGMPTLPWSPGGSVRLAKAVDKYLAKTNAPGAFLRNHGLITVGESLRNAAEATLMIEHTLGILLKCKQIGLEPDPIPSEDVKLLLEKYG